MQLIKNIHLQINILPMHQPKTGIQITEAFLFFTQPFTQPINQPKFEASLKAIKSTVSNPLIYQKIIPLLVERFYEVTNNNIALEEYLLLEFIEIMGMYVDKGTAQLNNQFFVIMLWGSISHLKNCTPEKNHKQIIRAMLTFMEKVVQILNKKEDFKLETIFPKVYSLTMNYVLNSDKIDHIIFEKCLVILALIFSSTFRNKIQVSFLQRSGQANFDTECINRLETHLLMLVEQVNSFSLPYQQAIKQWLKMMKPICLRYTKLLSPFYILSVCVDEFLLAHDKSLRSSERKIVQSAINKYFLQVIRGEKNINQTKSVLLKTIKNIASNVFLTGEEEIASALSTFTNKMYLISSYKNLVHLHNPFSIPLPELQPTHTFSTYDLSPTALVESFDFECERTLVTSIPFVESDLENVELLKKILINLPSQTKDLVLDYLTQNILKNQDEYMVDMSLTKFCQYLTKVLIIYWLLKRPDYKPRVNICEALFAYFTCSQAIRILNPSFKEEQMLIGITLSICTICYHRIIENPMKQIEKLKKKVNLVELVLNNIDENSFIIKSMTYNLMLVLAAPNSIKELVNNLQSTLINRNANHLKMIITILKYCQLTKKESENLVDRFLFKAGNQELFKILIPNLDTNYIRKCLLSTSKWFSVLLGNTNLLFNIKLEEKQMEKDKGDSFYMNDASNVIISNSLGVVVLELGEKWEGQLIGPYKEMVIDLMIQIGEADGKLVFFKGRFVKILQILGKILEQINESDKIHERLQRKIYRLLSILPDENYKLIFKGKIDTLEKVMKLKHKKIQLTYLTKTTKESEELYAYSENIIEKMSL